MLQKILFFPFLVFITVCALGQPDTSDASFYQVYSRVLSPSCALPACHDGSFEPDFRTPQSAYYTTVYQPVKKNNKAGTFKYRIKPYDPSGSLVYERITNCCFVNENDRMPLTILANGDTLTRSSISLIGSWINAGAKDLKGNSAMLIKLPPSISKEFAISGNDTTVFYEDIYGRGTRHTRVEDKPTKSLIIPMAIRSLKISFKIDYDPGTDSLWHAPILLVSESPSDFGHALSFQAKRVKGNYIADMDTKSFARDKIYFMHVEVWDNAKDHVEMYPEDNTLYTQKLHWSFIIKSESRKIK